MPQYCLVKHRISTYVIDGAGADRNPDRIPVTGVVTFEALLDKGDSVVVTEDGVATTITLAPIEARITNGEIYHRGEEGVKLFAGGPTSNPGRIRYRAKFSNLIAGGKRIDLKDILFEAVPGGEVALSIAQPIPGKPYPGYSATAEEVLAFGEKAQKAADRAEAGADRVGSAEQVGQWAHDAQGAAESTAADREAVATDRQAVAQDKIAVSELTVRAETAAGDAETHAELAEEKAGIATEASGKASASEQAAAQSASDAEAVRVAAEQARARAVQAENTATGAATTATNKATEANLAADRAEQATVGKADLIGGKVPSSQIPEVALTKPHPVADRTAMLSLPDVQQGDVAIIASGTDQGGYMLGEGDPTVFESWIPLSSGAGGVTSVNGQTGTVNLGASDVGASPVGHTHTPASIGAAPASHTHTVYQVSGLDDDLAGKADSVHTHTSSQVDGLDAALARLANIRAWFRGAGAPPASIPGAQVGDWWLNTTTMELHEITGV